MSANEQDCLKARFVFPNPQITDMQSKEMVDSIVLMQSEEVQ